MECFPAAYLDERAMEIRLLADHRNDLVVERTRIQNRLRWHRLALCRADPQPDPPGEHAQGRAVLADRGVAPQLLEELGCGPRTAAILIGRTGGAERFGGNASFALQTGTAPIKCSSGERHQHRLNRGGDRQLNHALHIIAITRAQHAPATREYLARKQVEGRTKKGALRCLNRHSPAASTSPFCASAFG